MPPHDLKPRVREKLQAFLDAPHSDPVIPPEDLQSLARREGIPIHASLLHLLTRIEMSEEEAERHWQAVVRHRQGLTRDLGRDVGWRVASLDYFLNRERTLTQPTLVDGSVLERTEHDAVTDGLTGLSSFRHFRAAVRREIRRSERHCLELSLVMLDPDRLCAVNALLGRGVGDSALREVAGVIRARIREIDMAARYEGSKFLLLLPRTRRVGAFVVAERIRAAVEERFRQPLDGGRRIDLTLSGGVGFFPEDASSADGLLGLARRALGRAKSAGKNNVVVYHAERRAGLRFKPLGPPLCARALLAGGATAGRVEVLNLSESGALLSSPELLSVGETMELRFESAPGPLPDLAVEASVARLEKRGKVGSEPPFDAGVRFEPVRKRPGKQIEGFLAGLRRRGIE